MVSCNYFTTNNILLDGLIEKSNDKDSFVIYICTEGNIDIETAMGKYNLNCGETILIPASIKNYKLIGKQANLLEVFV